MEIEDLSVHHDLLDGEFDFDEDENVLEISPANLIILSGGKTDVAYGTHDQPSLVLKDIFADHDASSLLGAPTSADLLQSLQAHQTSDLHQMKVKNVLKGVVKQEKSVQEGVRSMDESAFKYPSSTKYSDRGDFGSLCTSELDSHKRKRDIDDDGASSLLGGNSDCDDDDLPPGDRREKRRRSNRESARRGRIRRLEQLGKLEGEVQELHQQHALLLNKLAEAGDLLNAASRENRIYKTVAGFLGANQPELLKALQQANAAESTKDRSVNEISDEEAEAIAAAALASNENNPTKALMDLLNLAIQRNNMVM